MKRRLAWFTAIAGCCGALAIGATQPPRLRARPIEGKVDGPQFLQADKDGKVFLFAGGRTQLFPVSSKGLGAPIPLKSTSGLGDMIVDAAMAASGDEWLVLDGSLHRFVRGEETAIPPSPWLPAGVAFVGDTPIVVARQGMMRGGDPTQVPAAPPWILELRGDSWEPVVSGRWEDLGDDPGSAMAVSAARLARSSSGSFWLARHYAYRVTRFSAAGRLREELTVSGGRVEQLSREEEEKRRGAIDSQAQAMRPGSTPGSPPNVRAGVMTAVPAIQALTEGRDGKLYLLVNAPGGLAIDRYDGVTKTLARSSLPFTYTGRLSMAAGKDGLFIAAYQGTAGRWLVSWEDLERASWEPRKDLRVR